MKSCKIGPLLGVLLVCATAVPTLAQDEKKRELEIGRFYPGAEAGFTLTQSSFSDNWNGGDKGSVVWALIFNGSLENQVHKKMNWYNTLKLAFGQTHQQELNDGGERVWEKPEKTTDLVEFESLARFTLGAWLDPYASVGFESQFLDASDPFGRNLTLNPLKFRESAGVARKFIDEEDRSLLSRLGFAFHQSSRKIFEEAPPADATVSETTNDGGIEFITQYKTKILEDRVTWSSKLSLYQPVFFSGKDDFESLTDAQLMAVGIDPDIENFTTNLDIDFENIFTTQITEIISVSLYTRWLYDKYDNSVSPALNDAGELSDPVTVRTAVRKSGQFKQTLALGVTYRFL